MQTSKPQHLRLIAGRPVADLQRQFVEHSLAEADKPLGAAAFMNAAVLAFYALLALACVGALAILIMSLERMAL